MEKIIHFLEKHFSYLKKIYNKNFLFIIYESDVGARIYGTIENKKSFKYKMPLFLKWGGLRNEEQQKISGIKTATFVHVTGFTGGSGTTEDALKLCERSIEEYK